MIQRKPTIVRYGVKKTKPGRIVRTGRQVGKRITERKRRLKKKRPTRKRPN